MARLVTLFGGGGFLGRYVAQELMRDGTRIRIAQRDPKRAFFLRPLGGLGQTQFVAADVGRPETLQRAVEGADGVINLVGILKGDFDRFHVAGAKAVAEAARTAGATSFVHVSALGADPDAPSAYGRSKGLGEIAVRDAFPTATIVRPSIVFGPEDNFVNRFAQMARLAPAIPVIRGEAKFQPAYVVDVARVIAAAARDPLSHGGKIVELGGPETLSMQQIISWIGKETGHERSLLPVPDSVSELIAKFTGWLPGAPITHDQWLMLQKDNVVSEGATGFAEFGIAPTPLAAVAPEWLVSYRRHGRFAKTRKPA